MTCPICCATFNKSSRLAITCPKPECGEVACRECVRQYLIGSSLDPHCMHCRIEWEHDFTDSAIGSAFMRKEYKKHRADVLFSRMKAKVPELQEKAKQVLEIENLESENKKELLLIRELTAQIKQMKQNMNDRIHLIHQIKYGGQKKAKREFIMPCPDENCRGFLNSSYKCEICDKFSCAKCLAILGKTTDVEHECNRDMVKSVEQIKKETRPCPKCGERIFKVSGCDQMWCTAKDCGTPFSWKTGEIETGVIHNPHYFQWQRENVPNGQVARQPGDNPCGGNIDLNFIHQIFKKGVKTAEPELKKSLSNMIQFIASQERMKRHVENVTIVENRATIRELQTGENEGIMYILKKASDEKILDTLVKNDKKRKALTNLTNIHDMWVHCTDDILQPLKFLPYDATTLTRENWSSFVDTLRNIFQNILKLNQYNNLEMAKHSALYNASVIHLTSSFKPNETEPFHVWQTHYKFTKTAVQKMIAGN